MKRSIKDLIDRFQLRVSEAMVADLDSENSALALEIEKLPISINEQIYKAKLQILIVWYEAKLFATNQDILKNDELILNLSGLIWNDLQIKVIPYLINEQMTLAATQTVLFNTELYRSLHALIELNLSRSFPKLISSPQKRELLKLINEIDDEDVRKVCLVFLVKHPEFSVEILQRLLTEFNKYPLLAETLLALDATKTISIANLHSLALNPVRHIRTSILHRYKQEFDTFGLNQADLSKLNESDLEALGTGLKILRDNQCKDKAIYKWLIDKSDKGAILRQLLPSVSQVDNSKHREALINLLSISTQFGVVIQGQKLSEIKEPELLELAKDLRERFICVKQLNDLRIDELKIKQGIIEFAGKENNQKAHLFRQIIMKVEDECKVIHDRLGDSPQDKDVFTSWQKMDPSYRISLYCIAYDAINNVSPESLIERLKQAEINALAIVDPEIKQPLKKFLIVLANILITVLSLSFANLVKENYTGNFWFFTQSKSGEEIRALHKELTSVIEKSTSSFTV